MTAVDAYCQIKNGAHTHWVKQKNYEAIERKKYEHICGVHLNMGHHTGCSVSNSDISIYYVILIFVKEPKTRKLCLKKCTVK